VHSSFVMTVCHFGTKYPLLPPPMSLVPLSSDQPPQPSHQITVLAQGLYLSYITDYSTRTGSLPLLHYRLQYSHRVFTSLTLQITVLAQGLYLSYITDYSTRTGSLPLLHYRSQYSHRVFTSLTLQITVLAQGLYLSTAPYSKERDRQHDLPPTTSRAS